MNNIYLSLLVGLSLTLIRTSGAQTFSVENTGPSWDFLGTFEPLHGDALLRPTTHVLPIPLGPFNHLTTGTGTGGLDVNAFSFGYGPGTFINNLTDINFAVSRNSQGLSNTGVNREATENFGRLGEGPPVLPGLPAGNRGQAQDVFAAQPGLMSNFTLHDDDGFWDGGITPNPAPGMSLGFPNLGVGNNGIDALDMHDISAGLGNIGLNNIYYSLENSTATGGLNGATILRGPQANGFTASGVIYATPLQLGLVAADEITGLTIVDRDGDPNSYNPASGDVVFFSLSAASPSLASIDPTLIRPLNGNMAVPADVIQADNSGRTVAVRAEEIGLSIAPGSDTVNGFDLIFGVPEPSTFAMMLLGLLLFKFRHHRKQFKPF